MAKMRWVVPRRMLVFHEIRLIHANAFAFERFRFLRSYIQLASGGVFIVKRECAILMLLREHAAEQKRKRKQYDSDDDFPEIDHPWSIA